MEQLAAALIDRYRLERELGAGGMATVYLAEDLKHHRKVAIKVLREELGASLGPKRFVREINIAAALTHPHILPLHDSGEAAGLLFYVMPFVDGPTLRQRLEHGGEFPIAEAVHVLRDVADAMAYAHAHGVIHRDIKPENVMLAGRHALVTDFGVAKALTAAGSHPPERTDSAPDRWTATTSMGVALGTPAYMAPEQATADPLMDHRADIYAFGVLAYELLTGHPPFRGSSAQEVLAAHVTRAAEHVSVHRSAVPTVLASLVMKCLEKRPADRWQGAEELVTQLEGLPTPSGGMEPTVVVARSGVVKRRRVALGVAGAAAILGSAALAWLLLLRGGDVTAVMERIAVLPLENRTGDPARDRLGVLAADWVTRGLVDARLTEVVPSAVAMQAMSDARARKEDVLRAVATATGATRLVTGAFYSTGDSLRFEAEFLSAVTRTSVTGIRPSLAPASDAMVAIDSLRHRVMGAVAQLVGRGEGLRSSSPPPSLEAYQLVLRAVEGLYSGRYAEMERYYRQSFALDSTYVRAGAGLVNALWLLGRFAEADTVLRRVESLPLIAQDDALYVKLLRAILDGNREASYEMYKADSATLGDGSERVQLAIEAIHTARPREALGVLDQVNWRRADIRKSPDVWMLRAYAFYLLGENERALAEIRRSRRVFQSDVLLMRFEAIILAALGRKADLQRLKQMASASRGYDSTLIAIAAEQLLHGDTVSGRTTAREAIDWLRLQPAADSARNLGRMFSAGLLGGKPADLQVYVEIDCDSLAIDCWQRRGTAAALRGDTAMARAAALTIQRIPLTPRLREANASMALAQIFAALGDDDRAVAYLGDALSKGTPWGFYARLPFAPFLTLQAHKGFRELMRPRG